MNARASAGPLDPLSATPSAVGPARGMQALDDETDLAPAAEEARRVLVVDDSRLQRRILVSLLKRSGLEVVEAASGEEALALCRERPVEIVLSDWMMPGMSGLDLCRALRGEGEGRDYVYFILLTSKGEKAEIAEGLGVGADDFLTKPVDKAELGARIIAGERILAMQRELKETNRKRGEALAKVSALNAAIERDLRQSRDLQHSLIREWRRDFGAAEVSLLLRSSGHVGGDLVGFFPTGPGHVGLYGIDVSGHGITSALMSARLEGYLSSRTPERNVALGATEGGDLLGRPPAEVARALNDLTLNEMTTETYFTMVYADLDLASGTLRFAQAGHPPPLVLRADGRVEFAGAGGLPIGLIEDASWDEHWLHLEAGDRLIVYSDGVTECEDPSGAMLDEEGLSRLARTHAGLRGGAFLDAILAELRDHAGLCDCGPDETREGCVFPDDVSMVLLEHRGS